MVVYDEAAPVPGEVWDQLADMDSGVIIPTLPESPWDTSVDTNRDPNSTVPVPNDNTPRTAEEASYKQWGIFPTKATEAYHNSHIEKHPHGYRNGRTKVLPETRKANNRKRAKAAKASRKANR